MSYKLPAVHEGNCSNEAAEVAKRSLRAVKRGFIALGQPVKGLGTQAVFFTILPVTRKDEGRSRKSQQINTWLRAWCYWQNFGVFDHGLVYMTPGMLATDGVHLSQRGKRIFAQ